MWKTNEKMDLHFDHFFLFLRFDVKFGEKCAGNIPLYHFRFHLIRATYFRLARCLTVYQMKENLVQKLFQNSEYTYTKFGITACLYFSITIHQWTNCKWKQLMLTKNHQKCYILQPSYASQSSSSFYATSQS